MFDGLHSPTLPQLRASSMKVPEANIHRAYAQGLGISVEEVDLLIRFDQAATPGKTYQYVIDAWRETNLNNARGWMAGYNRANPMAKMYEGVMGPLGAGYMNGSATSPVVATTAAPVQQPASTQPIIANSYTMPTAATSAVQQAGAFLGGIFGGGTPAPAPAPVTIKDILTAAGQGAMDAATAKALETQAGQDAKKAGFKSFVKDNQLIIGLGGLAVAGLAYKAFTK